MVQHNSTLLEADQQSKIKKLETHKGEKTQEFNVIGNKLSNCRRIQKERKDTLNIITENKDLYSSTLSPQLEKDISKLDIVIKDFEAKQSSLSSQIIIINDKLRDLQKKYNVESDVTGDRKKKWRQIKDNRDKERVQDCKRKQKKRETQSNVEKEHDKDKRQVYRSTANLDKQISLFKDMTSEGPVFVCSCCNQCHFKETVVKISATADWKHPTLLDQCLQHSKQIGNDRMICLPCKKDIQSGMIPLLSMENKIGFPEKPAALELHQLEEAIIAPLLPFMTVRSLPVCGQTKHGQKLIVGNIVHVPNNINKTVCQLPRMLDDIGTIALQLKRKMVYKTCVFSANIRPSKIFYALRYLVEHSEMYKPYNIVLPDWLTHVLNTTHPNVNFVEGYHDKTSGANESNINHDTANDDMNVDDIGIEENSISGNSAHGDLNVSPDADQFEEISHSATTEGNLDTMLDDPTDIFENLAPSDGSNSEVTLVTGDKILTIAPGEGQIPVFREPNAEYLSFPTIFCGKTRPKNTERHRKVHTSSIFKAEMRNADLRVATNIQNIFWKAKHMQVKHVTEKFTLALRRVIGAKHSQITAEMLMDEEIRNKIPKLDEGYYIFRTIRNSPPYFDKLKKESLAMIRQLGLPTIFFSLSAADTSWIPLIQSLSQTIDKKVLTEQYIQNEMTFEKKCQLIASHPGLCSRFFHHRVQKFIHCIFKSTASPFGIMKDYMYRVEFQKRGSPHIHGLMWIENAPISNVASDNDICNYIDSCISCSVDVSADEEMYIKIQTHRHSRTCKIIKNGKRVCRFGVPWPPMQKTTIIHPLEDSHANFDILKCKWQTIQEKLKSIPDTVVTYGDWLEYINMTNEDYLACLRASVQRPKIFLRRLPKEIRVNSYMKHLLNVWQANHDVQYVMDAYEVITYVCDYMTKSQKGMSDLLHAACEEAKAGNMSLKESVRHMGNKFLNASESPVQECCYDLLGLPISDSSRKKEYINTVPSEERVGYTKDLEELKRLKPNSKDVLRKSNIERYCMRPKKIESWTLAEYVARTEIEFPKKSNHCDKNSDSENVVDLAIEEECDQDVIEESDGDLEGFPITMRNGIVLRLRKHNKILRFRNYRMLSDPENYYRERLMLYTAWRSETTIKGNYNTYKESFEANIEQIQQQMQTFEPMSAVLDIAMEQYDADIHCVNTAIAPSTQHIDMQDAAEVEEEDNNVSENYDIGPELGIAPVVGNDIQTDIRPNYVDDETYYGMLGLLNERQQCFHATIMCKAADVGCQTLCALHGGAGTGKSLVTRCIHQGLNRLLGAMPGEDPIVDNVMLMAPTGKAAYNIKGTTIHKALHIPASQALVHKPLGFDQLNSARSKFQYTKWILVDEFSMVGNKMLLYIHLRLQEIKGNNKPFGGLNVICIGDLYQLQPVMQKYIFEPLSDDYGPLATNLWTDHFTVYELHEIMRQKGDQPFAELLNRLRVGKHTASDILLLQQAQISHEKSVLLNTVPHFFPTRKQVNDHNTFVITHCPGEINVIRAIDAPPSDVSKKVQETLLAAARNKDINATANLQYELTLKLGQVYDIVANIDVNDGLINGAECVLRHIETNPNNKSFPSYLWVEFNNKNTGRDTRHKIGKHSHILRYSQNMWTPIAAIRRSFVVKRDQKITRTQFPLQLAAGRTIHKSQSSTYDSIVVDMHTVNKIPRTFWEHMHYVAFSRCTSLQGLHIVNINADNIFVSPKVIQYIENDVKPLTLPFYHDTDTNNIIVYYNNTGGLRKKWPAISQNVLLLDCDIVFLAETWLSPADDNTVYNIVGYMTHRYDSSIITARRGLLMFVKQSLHVLNVQRFETADVEYVIATVVHYNVEKTIVALYRPPNGSQKKFTQFLKDTVKGIPHNENILICGDFNIDDQDYVIPCLYCQEKNSCVKSHIAMSTTTAGTSIDKVFARKMSKVEVIPNTWSYHHSLRAFMP